MHDIHQTTLHLRPSPSAPFDMLDIAYDTLENSNMSFTVNDSVVCTNEYCVSDEEYIAMIEDYIYPSSAEWVLIILHVIVFVVGLVGNALVCVSVYRNHTMRTVTNYFIVNLALADFLVILVCLPPTVLWDVTETWFFGRMTCKLVLYLQSVSVSVSVLTLTFISIDRWYAICHPLSFKSTAARAKTNIFLIWLVSIIVALPEAIVLDTRKHPIPLETIYLTDCAYTWSESNTRIYQLFLLLFLYIIPFLLMAVAYYQIAKVLWNKNIPGSSETNHHASRTTISKQNGKNGTTVRLITVNPSCEGQIQSRRKAAKMLIAVVVIFGLCYFPVHLINALRYTVGLPQNPVTTVASLLSHWLCYANSSINPIIYNFMNGKFRKEFKNFLCCYCCRNSYRRRQMDHMTGTKYRFSTSVTQMENINLTTLDKT
ncbi:orexin receptor type 2 [Parasteatoda tepidariorum]|uniref:orexin receptor type 2 n=1 Tax=Parasteatoda tepidariorum TaxID=114398 RepID=UPI00077F8C6E|nr:orexin receptor type 2 [Parasteatoda tepidariorum]